MQHAGAVKSLAHVGTSDVCTVTGCGGEEISAGDIEVSLPVSWKDMVTMALDTGLV